MLNYKQNKMNMNPPHGLQTKPAMESEWYYAGEVTVESSPVLAFSNSCAFCLKVTQELKRMG